VPAGVATIAAMAPRSEPSDPPDAAAIGPDADAPRSPARPIRSFVLRGGRIGPGQQRALDELGPRYLLPFTAEPIDFDAVFGRRAPRVLEIGFGMGDASAAFAEAHPESDLLGIEVHPPGVGALLKQIGERGLNNVRIVRHDAVEVLGRMLASGALDAVHVWFPDPWHKKRHHKRRLIQPPLVALLADRLAPGGVLHCATDWQPYAEQMRDVLAAEPRLEPDRSTAPDGYAPRPPWRPRSKFEARGLRLGHGVWDLVFRRRSDEVSD
jgi:tRNA (guanine-N7-)-methyltransferase